MYLNCTSPQTQTPTLPLPLTRAPSLHPDQVKSAGTDANRDALAKVACDKLHSLGDSYCDHVPKLCSLNNAGNPTGMYGMNNQTVAQLARRQGQSRPPARGSARARARARARLLRRARQTRPWVGEG